MRYDAQVSLLNETYEKFLDLLSKSPDQERLSKCIDSCKKQLSDPVLIHELDAFWDEFKDF